MSEIRCIYHGAAPNFPATNQHPDARRYGPVIIEGVVCFVDAIGAPTFDEIKALITPAPPVELSPEQKLAAAGLSVAELKALLALPT